ncbi:hypothetical protein KSP39_PZI000398 [Platanthera zijinensis]|uniref:CCHC-type domain-containing protein n=1 Tax=Platanthera zijinensis TaxID=2320716 RepID=A0AAP0GFT0_9ASPA
MEWPLVNQNPIVPWPTVRRKAGRPPQHARRMEEEELETQKYGVKRHGLKYSCSQCGMRGHNKRNCGVVPISSTASSAKKLKNPVRRTE